MAGLSTRLADDEAEVPRSNESADTTVSDRTAGSPRQDPFLMEYDTSEFQVDHETIKEVLGGLIAVSNLV